MTAPDPPVDGASAPEPQASLQPSAPSADGGADGHPAPPGPAGPSAKPATGSGPRRGRRGPRSGAASRAHRKAFVETAAARSTFAWRPVRPIAAKMLLEGRSGWRRVASWCGTHINRMAYIERWLILASVIGVVAGLGAVLFYEALHLATQFFLGLLAGYHVPSPAGEGGSAGSGSFVHPWMIPIVVVIGALLAGVLVFTLAPEAEGHGTDAAIEAVHYNPRGIRLRAVIVKIIASALTIGSGGSGGREGPTAQISAGFGSLLARTLDLSPEDGRIAVSVGIGSGIGAIFSAPLGGAVLAADVVYREDFEFRALVPGIFASIIAYAIFGAFFGYHPLFATPAYSFTNPLQLLWFAIIGLCAGGIGILYSKGFYGAVNLAARLPFSRTLRPAFGAIFVGLMALALPQVLGTGYGWVQMGLANHLLTTPLWIILLLPFARIAATALSIGTGGSGGVFGPGMVIGAFTGLAVWRLVEPILPAVGTSPAPFVVVGMMAVFGGISRAPLAVTIMVAEMTGNLSIIGPAMVAIALSTFIVTTADETIYRSQPRSRSDSQASRMEFGMPMLAFLRVGPVAKPPRVVLHPKDSVATALKTLRARSVVGAPVVDEHGLFLGTVDTDRAERLADSDPEAPVSRVLDATTATVSEAARLNVALESLLQAGGTWVTVTGASREVVGILSMSDIVQGYQQTLETSALHIGQVTTEATTITGEISPTSPVAGHPLREAHLPPECLIVSIQRDAHMLFPTAATVLEAGDIVSALVNPAHLDEARRILLGPQGPTPSPKAQMV